MLQAEISILIRSEYICRAINWFLFITCIVHVIDRPQGSCGVWDIPKVLRERQSNPKGIPYTTASEESMWLVPQLTAFHQSQAEKSIPLGNTFGFRQLREQRLEKCGLCPTTLHFSRPLIGGRQATVVQKV